MGSYEIPGFSWTLVAGQDLRTSQFCAIDVEVSTGEAVLPSAGDRAIGVLRNNPNTGESATIVSSGITKAKIGPTGVVAGNNVTVNGAGKFIQAASGDVGIGVALQTNAADEIGTVLLLIGNAAVAGS